ncbi:hypothetical protein Catovirus_1_113 [Catovirus CTV1]|uniref:Uncharacterized protein n=1 Tax=Catovirus CTV1 TaxID=1977631 RepID=A0A1V0S8M8_9VIRU|nr:hypothetical protein Catovirus_1_113 [Catovirus CTV1]
MFDIKKIGDNCIGLTTNHIIKRENIFAQLNEKFDCKKMNEMILAGVLDESYNRSMLKYIKYSTKTNKNKNNYIYQNNVSYIIPENGIGRMKAVITKLLNKNNDGNYIKTKKSCVTQSLIWNQVKCYVLKDLYYDVDIVNCQPFILEQLIIKNKLKYEYIKIYNNNRDALFDEMINKLKLERRQIKEIMYQLIFGGGLGKLKHYGFDLSDLPNDIQNLISEINQKTIELLNIYPIYKEEAIKQKGADYWNINGTALSLLLQTEERKILECMYTFFVSEGYEIDCLVFDGLHLRKNKTVNDELLKDCCKFIHKELQYLPTLKIKPFDDIQLENMPVKRKFDLLDKKMLDEVSNLYVNYFDAESICPRDDKKFPFKNIDIFDSKKLKDILLIKARTGDGKTYFLKQVYKHLNANSKKILEGYKKFMTYDDVMNPWDDFDPLDNPDDKIIVDKRNDIKLLSLVSRVSLSNTHEMEFDLINYQKTNDHGLNEVYQLDSIDKFINVNNDFYVLFLDEVASLCSHFNNKMRKMTSNRIKMVQIFKSILNDPNCIQIIGCDDNMNNGTINFIRDLTKRKIHLHINTNKKILDTPVKIYTNLDAIIKDMKKNSLNQKIFCCSNRNQKFFETVVRPIIEEFKLEKDEYIIYSGDYGNRTNGFRSLSQLDEIEEDIDEFEQTINTADWNKIRIRFVFCTPSVLYGLSYDEIKTHAVYGFYFNNGPLDALLANQQINRIRHPRGISLYIEKSVYISFNTLDNAEEFIYSHIPREDDFYSKKHVKIEAAINNLFIYDEYLKSHLNDLFYYLPYLLRIKGYVNISIVADTEDKQKKFSNKEYNEILIKEYNDDVLDGKKLNDVTIKMNKYGFNTRIVKNTEQLLEFEDEVREKVLPIFTNNKHFRCLELYKMKIDKTYLTNLELDNDTKLNKTYSDEYKIKLLDELHIALNVEWFDTKLTEKLLANDKLLESFKVDETLYNRIGHKQRFNIRSGKPNNYLEWVIFLLKRYSMFSLDIIVNKNMNFTYKKKRYNMPEFNINLMDKLNMVVNYPNLIKSKIKDMNDQYLF